jgi:hypothetical protein
MSLMVNSDPDDRVAVVYGAFGLLWNNDLVECIILLGKLNLLVCALLDGSLLLHAESFGVYDWS